MHISRRHVLQLAGGAACLSACPGRGWAAASYPSRPVQVMVGVAAGGSSSVLARLMADWLSEQLGQPFVVVNRPGAGTNIATEAVVRAPADGYTLLWAAPANAVNATLFDNLTFNFIRDTAPIGSVVRVPLVMVVKPSFPARTVPEFIDYARRNPKVISAASPSVGTSNHMAGELFMMLSHVEMVHVHYRGSSPALSDLIGGHVQVMFDTLPVRLATSRRARCGRSR
jgi:tripartite-type tricarboxylate transporter receptor subunit TctC